MSDTDREALSLAREFHAAHETVWAASHRRTVMSWDEMPQSYQRRLTGTFAQLIRSGALSVGAQLSLM